MKNPELFARIASLDLGCIKLKLMHPTEGKGWSREKADEIETHYKRFLYLTETFDDTSIVPTTEIDDFWHQHILDTSKYADDCQQLFGHFVHHFPYFGMRGDDDANALMAAFAETKIIYHQEFGERYAAAFDDTESFESEIAGTCNQCNSGKCKKGMPESFARPVLA